MMRVLNSITQVLVDLAQFYRLHRLVGRSTPVAAAFATQQAFDATAAELRSFGLGVLVGVLLTLAGVLLVSVLGLGDLVAASPPAGINESIRAATDLESPGKGPGLTGDRSSSHGPRQHGAAGDQEGWL